MRMSKWKALLCLAAMLAVITGLFSGCQNAEEGESGDSGKTPVLTWWLIGSQPENLADGVEKINAYIEEKIGVRVNIKMASYSDWPDKINQLVNTGEKFDIMFTNETKYSRQVNQNAFADLTDLLASEAPVLYKSIPQEVWEGAKINGRIYAVPTYKDSSLTQYWVFDDAYVQKYQINVAATKDFEALDKVFTAMKQGEGKSFYPLNLTQGDGFSGLLSDYDGLTLGLQPIGVRYDDANRRVVSVLEQEEVMDRLKMLHKWYGAGIINPDAPTQKDAVKGRAFFSAQGYPGAEVGWQVNEGVEKYDTVQVFGPLYTKGTIQGSLNAVSSNSSYKKEALKLLQLVNTDRKLRDMLAFGVEGTDFEYANSERTVVKRLTDTWQIGNYAIGSYFNLSTLSDAPADQWDQVKALNARAESSACLGFTPDIGDLSTELANCQQTWDKYRYELLTGASDPVKMVPQIVKELNQSGMDKIITAVQAQIDAYYQ